MKDSAFEIDSIFLKKTSRIEAVSTIIGLSLLVYNYVEAYLRESLSLGPTHLQTLRLLGPEFEQVYLVKTEKPDETKTSTPMSPNTEGS
jgi:hypothetical protein